MSELGHERIGSAFRLAAFRISASLLALFGVLLGVTGDHAFLQVQGSEGMSPEQVAWVNDLFAGLWTTEVLLAAMLALVLIWRTGERPDTRALALFFVFLPLFNFDSPLRNLGVLGDSRVVDSAATVLGAATWWLALAAFLRFSAVFPRPLTPAHLHAAGLPRWRSRLLDAKAVWVSALLLGLLSGSLGVLMETGAGVPLPLTAILFALLLALIVGFLWTIVQGVRHLRIRYRTSGPADRRRILWVVQGFFLAMWAIFIGIAGLLPAALAAAAEAPWIWPTLPVLAIAAAPLVITVFLAIAIFYDGAIDPALVIRRTALYGAFGVVLTFLFAGVENLASSAIGARLGVPEGWAGWIGAGTVALVFGFARDGLSRLLGRIVGPVTRSGSVESRLRTDGTEGTDHT
jgi:hypothetical protein